MIEVFLFILKYKITKDESSLSKHLEEFFRLSNKSQEKVLDKYFNNLNSNFNIDYYFNSKESIVYKDGRELSFFDSYYFCKKSIELNVYNIYLIDKFNISNKRINNLIEYALNKIRDEKIKIDIEKILIYQNELPKRLSKNIEFIKYLISLNIYNIKYITYNEEKSQEQREIIKETIEKAKKREFNLNNFIINNNKLSEFLLTNIDFLSYIIENDIKNIKYLKDTIINETDSNKKKIIKSIIKYIDKHNLDISLLENNNIMNHLSKDYEFIDYIIKKNVDNVKYVDWHNLPDMYVTKIINSLALKLVKEKLDFNIEKYPFKNIFKQNYMFMAYLIDKDKKYIKDIMVSNKDEVNKLVDIYLNKYRKSPFNIKEYIDDTGYINNHLIENKYMLLYFLKNDNNIFKYINFLGIDNSKEVVEIIVKELEKNTLEFNNDNFLVDNKYPIPLSNSYLFMRYVIDKNFNNLSYIDTSMIDKKELKRIINYAFRMVYYIRGNDKKLNFDIEGYFKNSMIKDDEYFKECLESL